VTLREAPTESAGSRIAWARVAAASAATALALAAGLAGAAFGLQAMALPRPTESQLVVAKTMRWLTAQKAVEGRAIVQGRTFSSLCVDALVGPHHVHGSLLVTAHERIVDTRLAAFRVGRTLREEDGPGLSTKAVLAGCPRALEQRLGRLLDYRVPVSTERAVLDGLPVLKLAFARRSSRLLLLVRPRSFVPVAVRIAGKRRGWTRLAPAEPSDLTTPSLRLSRPLRLVVKETL
jgi:hypothetical protein